MIRPFAAAAVAVALVAAPLAGPAQADTITPAPGHPVSLATTSSDVLLIFYRDTAAGVRVQHRSAGWHGAQSTSVLGGSVSTAPAGMVYRTGLDAQYWVAAAGTNGAVYTRHTQGWPPSDWTPWASLGGGTTSPPAIGCTSEGGPPALYVRGSDGALWTRSTAGSSVWARVGGHLLSGPVAVLPDDGDCWTGPPSEVVALGGDSAVWRWRAGTWGRIGGKSAFAPALVHYGDSEHAFAVGTNGALYHASRSGTFRWSAFTKIGGTFTTAPSAAVWSEHPPYDEAGLTVTALGTNGKLYRATRSLTSPGAWTIEPA